MPNPFPSQKKVAWLREQYPKGTRLELIEMDDVYAPPAGTKGTVKGVDDAGHILIRWDTGSGLNLIPDIDSFKVVKE